MLTPLLLVGARALAVTTTVSPGDDLFAILSSLAAGDVVVVEAGTYPSQSAGGSWFREASWQGTAAQPVLVRAAAGSRPVLQGDPAGSENVLDLEGSHFTLRGFEIIGGSHGLRLGNVDHATFEDLLIHGVHDVGLSCNRPSRLCDRITVRWSEIYDTGLSGNGEGMYLGCNDALCTVRDSIFEYNFIHDLGGSQGDGIEIKTGSHGNVVRHNVIVGSIYPAITMYGFASGLGARNLVEGNFVWGTQDNGIQVVGQIVVRNNVVVGAAANGIHSKPSQGFLPHDVEVVHNTVFDAGVACLKTNDWGSLAGQVVANNALYCAGGMAVYMVGGPTTASLAGNVTLGGVAAPSGFIAGGGAVADLGDPASLVLYPPAGSALVGAGDLGLAASTDFNGRARDDGAPDAGAYERTGSSNSGWSLGAGFKDVVFRDGFEAGDTAAWSSAPP